MMRPTSACIPFMLAATVACGDTSGPEVLLISVAPAAVTFNAIGDTVQLVATVTDEAGNPRTADAMSWSSEEPSVARVDAEGRVVSTGVGSTRIRASVEAAGGTAEILVRQVVAGLEAARSADTVIVRGSQSLHAVAVDSNGVAVEDAEIMWTSSNDEVVSVDPEGIATGHAEGDVEVTAAVGEFTAAIAVTALRMLTIVRVDDDGYWKIFTIRSDGTDLRKLIPEVSNDYYPAWSPDGARLAFVSDRAARPLTDLYVMNADGSGLQRLTELGAHVAWPAWSPDGTRIAFAATHEGNLEIYVINADGTGITNLTNNPADDDHPTWAADGTRIAFMTERDGQEEIYVMNADGSMATNITDHPAIWEDDPDWSPDGSRIVYRSVRNGGFVLYSMNPDGTDVVQLTDVNDGHPAWSPEGDLIAFMSARDGTQDIYIMRPDGSGVRALVKDAVLDQMPSWR